MNMSTKQLEQLAIDAHERGDTWPEFWSRHAADVAALELDYYARGEMVHRLVGLVASGDCDGQTAAGDSAPWERDEPPSYPATDDATVARLLWSPGR